MENEQTRPISTPIFWLAAFILAWCIDLFFFGQAAGISFFAWIALGVAALFAVGWWQRKRPAVLSYVLAAVSLALAFTVFLRSEPFSSTISGIFAVVALGLLAATFTNGNWLVYRIGDFLLAGLKLIAAGIIRGGQSLMRKTAAEGELPAKSAWSGLRRGAFPILRGVLLALPVIAVLAALLASADPVFGRLLENIFKVFDIDRLPEYIFRFTYVLIFTYLFTGVLFHAVFPEPAENRPDPNQPWKMRFLGSTEAGIILGSVVLLFAVFVAVQVRYLFGGQANINETGFTYADYARRGFFELVRVAVLSLGLYIGLSTVTRRETPRQERAFTLLTITLISLVLVILASALQRLLLYENAYGFTRLRTYTHIFIPWLACLLLVAMLLQAARRPGHLGLSIMLVTIGFCLTFSVINVDAMITRLNLLRARAGQALDVEHLISLSADAVPVMVQAYQDPSYPAAEHERLGAVLACRQATLTAATDWRSYRYADARAAALLKNLDVSAYPVLMDEYEFPYIQFESQQLYCRQQTWD